MLIKELPDRSLPNETQSIYLSSFVMTIHAACEVYIEDLAAYVVKDSVDKFERCGFISNPLWSLVLSQKMPNGPQMHHLSGPRSFKSSVTDAIYAAKTAFTSVTSENHGIKTSNQRAIFGPLGLRIEDFDHTLSQAFNGLGEHRGDHAHQIGIKHTRVKSGWLSEVDKIQNLVLLYDQFVCGEIDRPLR